MLTSKIPSYFKDRRDRLMASVQSADGASAVLLPATPVPTRNGDVAYPFRQDSSLYYLTGFSEEESWLLLAPTFAPGIAQPTGYRTILFVMARDPEKEMWEGERYGVEGARKVFGVDEAWFVGELDQRLPELFARCNRVFYRLGRSEANDRRVLKALESARKKAGRTGRSLAAIVDPESLLGEMRLYKQPEEIELLRRAGEITSDGHREAMRAAKPGVNEAEIEALIDHRFRAGGCARNGYGSIVAGGKNAACLHYRANNESLKAGDLLLIDAGGEYEHYTADITRTFPVGPRFTPAQARVYELVLKSQKAAIELCKPGETIPAIHRRVCEILTEGMLSLGLLHGKAEEIVEQGTYRRFYPHQTSHWLGMDVHDVGLYLLDGNPRPLEPGMVLTIEPGFYVQPGDADVPAEYRNIGIRIEDDILITAKGCENLTSSAPKEIEEIEALKK